MAQEELGRVLTALSKAMRVMCIDTHDLRGRWKNATATGLDGTWEGDFPAGELKERFNEIKPSLTKSPESEEEAKTLILKLIQLHDSVEIEYYRRHSGGMS